MAAINILARPSNQYTLTTIEAAKYLGCSPKTLQYWRCTGVKQIPYVRKGRDCMYCADDLELYIQSTLRLHA